MKRFFLFVILAALLSGCAAEPVYETIGNAMEDTLPVSAPGKIGLALDTGAELAEDAFGGKSCVIGDAQVWTRVCDGGDLRATLEELTGLREEALCVMEHTRMGMPCSEAVWTAVGDEGTLVCRTAVLDDGSYHYCVSMAVPEEDAQTLGESFAILLEGVSISGIDP